MLTAYRHKQNDSKEKKESAENNLSSSTLVIEEQDLLAANDFHDTAEALKASSLNPTQDQLQKKRFIDTICHELRTSLHGIDGNAHILGSIIADLEEILTCSDEKLLNLKLRDLLLDKIKLQKEGLYIIDVCAKHQKVITDDVLTISKIESGMLALNFQPLSPKKIIKQVMDILRVEIRKKKITVYSNIAYQDTVANIDPDRLRQVLLNLMSNAIKFTSEGGELTITLSNPEVTQTNTVLKFSVKDNGIGMSEIEKAHLFMPYSQANSKISTQYGGSGLGLCISKNLIELMGGKIEVESKKGIGTTFSFSVTCPNKIEIQNQCVSPVIFAPLKREVGQNERILIVEDNQINQKIVKNYLNQVGYICDTADNGEEGLKLWSQNSFQVILMDCEMPVMDGFEATRLIRKKEETMSGVDPVIIIGLSANIFTEALLEKITKVGMNDYLSKPFDKIKLIETIAIHSSKFTHAGKKIFSATQNCLGEDAHAYR